MSGKEGEIETILRAARELALGAGAIVLRHFGGIVEAETKDDGTPVTAADREAEGYLRREIEGRFPGHGILGEEYGESNPSARVRWILDPIDGTRTFVRGVPLFGVLVGVEVEGVASVGVVHFPALSETVSAGLGLGCRWNGRPARVSPVEDLQAAAVLATEPADLLAGPVGRGWATLVQTASLARTWGDCYGHALVATGRAEVMIDPVLSPWDAAPFLPILKEAGGRFTDLSGMSGLEGGSGISTNGLLHEEVLALLRVG